MNKLKIYLHFILFLLLFGCKKDEPFVDIPPVSTHRSVLVYLGADNNFRAEARQKIEQLRSGWDKDIDGNLLVYADAGDSPVWVHIYHSSRKGNVADTIAVYPAENSARPETLRRMINKLQEDYPAESYGLVVLSHATGWVPADMSLPTIALRSVILDRGTVDPDNYMELSAFADAIPYKLDFMVFDACFMGSVEVAYELKDKTDYIVASPSEVLVPGFVYPTMMQHLFRAQLDLTAVAREFYEYYDAQKGISRSATVSVVKTSGLDALAAFTGELPTPTGSNDNLINSVQHFGYGQQKIYFDFGDYIQKLAPERYDEFQAILNQCVGYKASTPSYYSEGTSSLKAISSFSGLSVYIPQANYPVLNEWYKTLEWYKAVSKQ